MPQRFFLQTKITDSIAILEGDQAHHAMHVMRLKVGDQITLFDGVGNEHTATVSLLEKKKLHLAIDSSQKTERRVSRDITLAVALPKGDRQKFLVEKLVELGVSRLIPLQTSRSVAVANDKVIGRIKKQIVEASKQCKRNYLMQVDSQTTIRNLVQNALAQSLRLVAHPYAEQTIQRVETDKPVIMAIGPEGGFSDEEMADFKTAEWNDVKLGPTILRIETAAIAAAVLLGSS